MPVLTPKGHYVIGKCEAEHENKGKKFEKNDGGGVWFKCGKPLGNGKFCDAPFSPADGEPLCDRDGAPVNGEGSAPEVGETGDGADVGSASRKKPGDHGPGDAPAPTTNEELAERFELLAAAFETIQQVCDEIAQYHREGSS